MTTGFIFDIKRFSLHDGPGIRTTLFLKGCPLNCWWCHNPEGQARGPELVLQPERCIACGACVEVCEQGAIDLQPDGPSTDRTLCTVCGACAETCYTDARGIVGRRVGVSEVMDDVKRDNAFYDQSGGGVTISGGEPLAQPEFLRDLLAACRAWGLHTALDTCGFAPWRTLDSVRADVDLFLYDLKLLDDGRHRQYTGVSNVRVVDNLKRLSEEGHRIVLRVPIIPGVNDQKEDVQQLGTVAASLPSLERVDLLPYHRIGRDKYRRLGKLCPMPEVDPPSTQQIDEIARQLRVCGLTVTRA